MKLSRLLTLVSVFVLLILVLACGGTVSTQEEAAPPDGAKTVVIGYTASKTGSQEVPSRGQTRGLELWLEQVIHQPAQRVGPAAIDQNRPVALVDLADSAVGRDARVVFGLVEPLQLPQGPPQLHLLFVQLVDPGFQLGRRPVGALAGLGQPGGLRRRLRGHLLPFLHRALVLAEAVGVEAVLVVGVEGGCKEPQQREL